MEEAETSTGAGARLRGSGNGGLEEGFQSSVGGIDNLIDLPGALVEGSQAELEPLNKSFEFELDLREWRAWVLRLAGIAPLLF